MLQSLMPSHLAWGSDSPLDALQLCIPGARPMGFVQTNRATAMLLALPETVVGPRQMGLEPIAVLAVDRTEEEWASLRPSHRAVLLSVALARGAVSPNLAAFVKENEANSLNQNLSYRPMGSLEPASPSSPVAQHVYWRALIGQTEAHRWIEALMANDKKCIAQLGHGWLGMDTIPQRGANVMPEVFQYFDAQRRPNKAAATATTNDDKERFLRTLRQSL